MKTIASYLNILILFIFGTAGISTSAALEDISIEINTSKTSIAIGDSLSLFCTVTFPEGVQVGEPVIDGKSQLFDIEKLWEKNVASGNGLTSKQYGFLIYAFSPDTFLVGPFVMEYVTADGESGKAESNTITLNVTGVVKDSETPPLPNRNPLEIASEGISAWLLILLASLLIITALLIVYVIHRKKTLASPVFEKPIDEIGEFERIRKLKLYESGQLKDLYILVSFALRGFIHRNMNFDALFETTGEIVNNLNRTPYKNEVKNAISEILEESDQVKYAKYIPPAKSASTVIDRALIQIKTVLDEIARKKELETARESALEKSTVMMEGK